MKTTRSAVLMSLLTAACMGAHSQEPQSKDVASQSRNIEKLEAATEDGQQGFKTLEDRFSYAYGADLAEKFKAEGIQMNVALMAEAMQTVFAGGEKKMSTDEVAATIRIYQEVFLKEKEAKLAAAGEKNKKEGEAFLAANAKKKGVVVTPSGLQYKVIKEGKGGYKPTADDEVTVHYRGTFIDGTEFDSTYQRNQPYTNAAKALIQGWTEAIQLMSEGAKWALYVPAHLAYGEKGSDPYIGPNAVLIFEVELLEIKKQTP